MMMRTHKCMHQQNKHKLHVYDQLQYTSNILAKIYISQFSLPNSLEFSGNSLWQT